MKTVRYRGGGLMKGYLVFEDQTVIEGIAVGRTEPVVGEICCHTDMAGFESVLFSPVNHGKIISLTFPIIGACGLCGDYMTGAGRPKAVIAKRFEPLLYDMPGFWDIGSVLEERGIFGLHHVDTRQIMVKIRDDGLKKAMLTVTAPTEETVRELKNRALEERAVAEMSTARYTYINGGDEAVGILDLGAGLNLADKIKAYGISSHVFAYNTPPEEIRAKNIKKLFLSHGGGSVKTIDGVLDCIRALQGRMALYGWGLGFLALAKLSGCEIYGMPNGRRGGNYPVMEISSGKVAITSQNLGEAIVKEAMPHGVEILYENCNDGGVAGIRTAFYEAVGFDLEPDLATGKNEILKRWLGVAVDA